MRLLSDFLPILLFFGTFKVAEARPDEAAAFATSQLGALVSGGTVGAAEAPVLLATVVVILATVLQVGWRLSRGRRVEPMLWVSVALVVVLGGLTVWFHNATFIKWKPSVLYWAMGLTLWGSQVLFRRNLLRALMGQQVDLPTRVWQRLNFAWVAFFAFMGLLNLWVAHTWSTEVWVDFKLFGGLGLLLIFTLAQGLLISRYVDDRSPRSATDTVVPKS